MSRQILFLISIFFISLNSFSQGFEKTFQYLVDADDTAGQNSMLREWEFSEPRNPELYTSYFNYYLRKSRKEIKKEKRTELVLRLDDSTENKSGTPANASSYNEEYLAKAFEYIDKGISLFPDRLDMRFGKIYMLGQTTRYISFTGEIIKTIEHSSENKNAWLWKDNKPQENGKDFMLSTIQSYVVQIYNIANDTLLDCMKNISESVLKYYPDHVESLSNLAVTYMVKGDFDNALTSLLKAEKFAPDDYIVAGNIAYCYYEKKDKVNAIKYFELSEKNGDDKTKEFAREKLEELKLK